ncbi:RICIN domain-containing protein [Streptomyces sp. BE303]|uniref:RICIN domain-containing protein n=1 Tax=Streptomyces sp. BE303 TaxID=3002528 RepID=UPI002E7831D7|nr:hypothetical protein [Streptomyces sp. BE303]MED7952477.1 hypothetical protein [Streptomyces sp. BE303]
MTTRRYDQEGKSMTKRRSGAARRLGAVLGAAVTVGALLTVGAPAASADPMDGYSCEGGGYRILTPHTYGGERMVLQVSQERGEHGSIIQAPWDGEAVQQWQLCSRPDPDHPGSRFYQLKDHARWWCLAVDHGYEGDGAWLLTEGCSTATRQVFWSKPVPGTDLVALQAQHSNSWVAVQGGWWAAHAVQMQFQADLFTLHKVW